MTDHFYVTTPIYYINDVPHLGSAYTTIAADVLYRYQKLRGFEAYALTGTDEHGKKIQRAAEQRGTDPQSLADEMSVKFREAWPKLSCDFNDFIRTTEERHKSSVQQLWRKIREAGDLYLGNYTGLHCVGCEAYYTEKELQQPGNLCPIHHTPAEPVEEESYFFRLSKYADRLLDLYERRPDFISPQSRRNEVISFVKGGLQDLCVSRTSFRWGIPVPDDDRHVMYVWFDALTNYFSALQEPEENRQFWPPDVHLVGKDILRFHAVYWPAFLMSAGFAEEQLPRKILAHGFLTYGGHKMSKSLRNTISPMSLAEALSSTVGVDTLRYCLMRSISFGQDGDFSIDDLLQRYAADLGNTLGNLLNRVKPFAEADLKLAEPGEMEGEISAVVETAARSAAEAYDSYSPTRALEAIWSGLAATNTYVDRSAPWKAKKEGDRRRLATIMSTLVRVLEAMSVMLSPVMPNVAKAMREQLGLAPLTPVVGEDRWPLQLPERDPDLPLAPGDPIFPRFDKKHIAELRARFAPAAEPAVEEAEQEAKSEGAAGKPPIEYDDFSRLDLRIGVITEAGKIKRKDRLLQLKVEVGEAEPRSIIAGIAKFYPEPEQLVGRHVAVLCNLPPRNFGKGLVSQGMLLAATGPEVVRVLEVGEELPPGSKIS